MSLPSANSHHTSSKEKDSNMSPRELTLIVAATNKMGIGRAGGLPWKGMKKDMAYFARVTKRANLGVNISISNSTTQLMLQADNQCRRDGQNNLGKHTTSLPAIERSDEHYYKPSIEARVCPRRRGCELD